MIKKMVMMVLPQYGIVQMLEYFLIPMAVLGGCVAAGAIMRRKCFRLYCLLCGGRLRFESGKETE